ncbi:alpha/beta fold hydrolase [Kitasatospora sp. NPDC002040]|uniref:thioesterase II family protein n=1 Tax=Kitasatospora sp. NPDC002040 TaxID=3154661 RepID=UPI0033166F13
MSKWIRRFRQVPGASARLVCFPHAGGSASSYLPMATAFQERVEVLSVQYPGRQDRFGEPCAKDIDELLDAVVDALAPTLADDRPVGLFGHSMGALVAFETARRLEQEGQPPTVLFTSARQGPALPLQAPGAANFEVNDASLLEGVMALGGIESELLAHPELLELVLPALRGDYRLLSMYQHQPGPPLSCPLVALVGDSDPCVPVEGVRTWERETLGPSELHVLPGSHFYLDDQLPQVVEIISASLLGRVQQAHAMD